MKADAQAFVNSGGGEGTYWELLLPMTAATKALPVKAGDYGPADNFVNAADYVTWRNNVGGTTLANETVSLGSVDAEDYAEWRAHFGNNYTQITTIIDNVRFANRRLRRGCTRGERCTGTIECRVDFSCRDGRIRLPSKL